jgi:RNA polymerase sigma factor (sigma-70 family)
MDDLELLGAYAAHGDQEAIRALVQKYRAMVLATCRRHAACEADAEDAMQEVFLSLLEHAGAIKSNLGGWLHRCAVNAAVLTTRNRQRRTRWENEKARTATGVWHEAPAAGGEHLAILASCLDELAAADRRILLGNCVEGQTQRDIASSLGVTQQAVAKRLGRTLAELRRKLTSRGVILSLAAGVVLLGKRAARAAIPHALRALGGSAHATVAASGGTALGAAAKLTAAAIVVISAASTYEHHPAGDVSRPDPAGNAIVATSSAGPVSGRLGGGRNWAGGPALWTMPRVRPARAAGLPAVAARPAAAARLGVNGTRNEPLAQAEDQRGVDASEASKATVAQSADNSLEDRSSPVGSLAKLKLARASRARKAAASAEGGGPHELTGDEIKDAAAAAEAVPGPRVGQGGLAAAAPTPPGPAKEPPALASESPAASPVVPPFGHQAEQAAVSPKGPPPEPPADQLAPPGQGCERPQVGHRPPPLNGGGEQELAAAQIASAGPPSGMPEVPHHMNSAPPPPPPTQAAPGNPPADLPPGRPSGNSDSMPPQSPPAADGAVVAAGAAVTERSNSSSAATGAAAVSDSSGPSHGSGHGNAASDQTVPADSIAAAVLDPTGSPPPSPHGGPPSAAPGSSHGDATSSVGAGQADAPPKPPLDQSPDQPPAHAPDQLPGQSPVVPDNQQGQPPVPPVTLTPTPDDAPHHGAAGGPQGRPEDGAAAPHGDGAGRRGQDSAVPLGFAGDWQDVLPPGEGDSASAVRAVPEPTIALTLLACLPILLRRRRGRRAE